MGPPPPWWASPDPCRRRCGPRWRWRCPSVISGSPASAPSPRAGAWPASSTGPPCCGAMRARAGCTTPMSSAGGQSWTPPCQPSPGRTRRRPSRPDRYRVTIPEGAKLKTYWRPRAAAAPLRRAVRPAWPHQHQGHPPRDHDRRRRCLSHSGRIPQVRPRRGDRRQRTPDRRHLQALRRALAGARILPARRIRVRRIIENEQRQRIEGLQARVELDRGLLQCDVAGTRSHRPPSPLRGANCAACSAHPSRLGVPR